MKNKRFPHPATCFFLLTGLVTFVSWVGSVYGWSGVRSLLGDEGLRWVLRTLGTVYLSPLVLPVILALFPGFGLWSDSGIGKACRSMVSGQRESLSRKERRALVLSAVTFGLYIGILLLLVWGPWGVASSVVGSFQGSPLADGFWWVVSFGIALPSVAYGIASDAYLSDRDVVRGMSAMFVRKSDYLVTLFFVLFFFASLDYTGLAMCAGLSSETLGWICGACCFLLLCV